MSGQPKKTKVNVIPTMRYRDAAIAVDWLCSAFGFTKHMVVPHQDGTIMHAQLAFGNGMIMLGTARDDPYGELVKPADAGTAGTQGMYVVVEDADVHYEQAVAAGAKIVVELKDEDYGGRDYTCRDLEGHVWTFGTYDPWA